MFSITTVDSSTKMPTESASPPSVMILIVWPAPHSATTPVSNAKGIVITTINELRQSRRNTSTINPVRTAPSNPSFTTDNREFRTYEDWSNWYSILMSCGTTDWNCARLVLTSLTTVIVEASARLVTGM